jgi:hypothetical protein
VLNAKNLPALAGGEVKYDFIPDFRYIFGCGMVAGAVLLLVGWGLFELASMLIDVSVSVGL